MGGGGGGGPGGNTSLGSTGPLEGGLSTVREGGCWTWRDPVHLTFRPGHSPGGQAKPEFISGAAFPVRVFWGSSGPTGGSGRRLLLEGVPQG